jgi:hypothetical protein
VTLRRGNDGNFQAQVTKTLGPSNPVGLIGKSETRFLELPSRALRNSKTFRPVARDAAFRRLAAGVVGDLLDQRPITAPHLRIKRTRPEDLSGQAARRIARFTSR